MLQNYSNGIYLWCPVLFYYTNISLNYYYATSIKNYFYAFRNRG